MSVQEAAATSTTQTTYVRGTEERQNLRRETQTAKTILGKEISPPSPRKVVAMDYTTGEEFKPFESHDSEEVRQLKETIAIKNKKIEELSNRIKELTEENEAFARSTTSSTDAMLQTSLSASLIQRQLQTSEHETKGISLEDAEKASKELDTGEIQTTEAAIVVCKNFEHIVDAALQLKGKADKLYKNIKGTTPPQLKLDYEKLAESYMKTFELAQKIMITEAIYFLRCHKKKVALKEQNSEILIKKSEEEKSSVDLGSESLTENFDVKASDVLTNAHHGYDSVMDRLTCCVRQLNYIHAVVNNKSTWFPEEIYKLPYVQTSNTQIPY